MRTSIICIGNRFVEEDAAGPQVFDRLQTMQPLPAGIELVEGGLAGLNLLPLLEQGGRVVFVDAVKGFTHPGEIVLLTHQEILQTPGQFSFDHGAGLPYLLAVLPKVYDGEMPEEIVLLGLEGRCGEETIEKAANMSVTIAAHGLRGLG
ncbi:MAG: hydrogenase maturation protease [Proteobacteria bacterium]|nr:hydrogenase maturation protease [Pseudomonadota bacterium]